MIANGKPAKRLGIQLLKRQVFGKHFNAGTDDGSVEGIDQSLALFDVVVELPQKYAGGERCASNQARCGIQGVGSIVRNRQAIHRKAASFGDGRGKPTTDGRGHSVAKELGKPCLYECLGLRHNVGVSCGAKLALPFQRGICSSKLGIIGIRVISLTKSPVNDMVHKVPAKRREFKNGFYQALANRYTHSIDKRGTSQIGAGIDAINILPFRVEYIHNLGRR